MSRARYLRSLEQQVLRIGSAIPSQFGIVGAVNWQRRLVRAEHTSAHTITTVTHSQRRIVGAANVGSTDQYVLPMLTKGYFRAFFYGSEQQKICRLGSGKKLNLADYSTTKNSRHLQHILLLAENTIIFCFTSGKINNSLCKMAAH